MTTAGVAVALGDLVLIAVCWRTRTALAGTLGAIGIPLVAFALLSGARRHASEQALLIAAGALVLGVVLFALGQVLGRLLDAEPED